MDFSVVQAFCVIGKRTIRLANLPDVNDAEAPCCFTKYLRLRVLGRQSQEITTCLSGAFFRVISLVGAIRPGFRCDIRP